MLLITKYVNKLVHYTSCIDRTTIFRDLIRHLLVADRTRRLGSMKNGADDVKRHAWFHSIDWLAVEEKKLLVSGLLEQISRPHTLAILLLVLPT